MDFSLSKEQKMLQSTARDFLKAECSKSLLRDLDSGDLGYSPRLWRSMAQMGWLGSAIPTQYGGAGGTLMDLAILFEELGRAACPSPMFGTIALAAMLITDSESEAHKPALLPGIAAGETILALALSEPNMDYDPNAIVTSAVPEGDGYRVDGVKLFVPYAHVTDYLLVVARTGRPDASPNPMSDHEGLSVLLVAKGAPGLTVRPLSTIGVDRQCEVRFDSVLVPAEALIGDLGKGWPLVTRTLCKATALQCAEMVGVAQQALELSCAHVSSRTQFGRPIGSFQAVQMRLANMMLDVEGARWTAYQALCAIDSGRSGEMETAIAKAWAGDACQRVAFDAQRLHGGLGVDLDSGLHFYFRKAKSLELNLGSSPFHRKTIVGQLKTQLLNQTISR